MSINPYYIPAEQPIRDTYTPQYVPLPIKELDDALSTRKSELDALEAIRYKTSQVPIEWLDADEELGMEKKKWMEDKAEYFSNAFSDLGNVISNPEEYRKKEREFNQFVFDLEKETKDATGSIYALSASKKQYQQLMENIDKMEKVSEAVKNQYKRDAYRRYEQNKGILKDYKPGGQYTLFSGSTPADYFDIEEHLRVNLKEQTADLYENVNVDENGRIVNPQNLGSWFLQKGIFNNQDEMQSWYEDWRQNNFSREFLDASVSSSLAKKLLYNNPNAFEFISDVAYAQTGDVGTDEHRKTIDAVVNEYANTFGQIFSYDKVKYNQERQTNNLTDVGYNMFGAVKEVYPTPTVNVKAKTVAVEQPTSISAGGGDNEGNDFNESINNHKQDLITEAKNFLFNINSKYTEDYFNQNNIPPTDVLRHVANNDANPQNRREASELLLNLGLDETLQMNVNNKASEKMSKQNPTAYKFIEPTNNYVKTLEEDFSTYNPAHNSFANDLNEVLNNPEKSEEVSKVIFNSIIDNFASESVLPDEFFGDYRDVDYYNIDKLVKDLADVSDIDFKIQRETLDQITTSLRTLDYTTEEINSITQALNDIENSAFRSSLERAKATAIGIKKATETLEEYVKEEAKGRGVTQRTGAVDLKYPIYQIDSKSNKIIHASKTQEDLRKTIDDNKSTVSNSILNAPGLGTIRKPNGKIINIDKNNTLNAHFEDKISGFAGQDVTIDLKSFETNYTSSSPLDKGRNGWYSTFNLINNKGEVVATYSGYSHKNSVEVDILGGFTDTDVEVNNINEEINHISYMSYQTGFKDYENIPLMGLQDNPIIKMIGKRYNYMRNTGVSTEFSKDGKSNWISRDEVVADIINRNK